MSFGDSFKNAFRGFDINNMEASTAWSWPIGVKIVVCLLLYGSLVGAGVYFLLLDKHEQLNREVAKERDLKSQYESKAFQVASLDALRQQMADVELRFSELLRQLPTAKEVPGLLDDISGIGEDSGLAIDSIALQAERKAQFYVELPINIQVSGTYHQMGEFVSGVSAIKRIVTLHDYSIRPAGGNMLNMTISAKTYRYDDTE